MLTSRSSARAARRLPALAQKPDGSVLSLISGVPVRVLPAPLHVTVPDGPRDGANYRQVPTHTNPPRIPPGALVAV